MRMLRLLFTLARVCVIGFILLSSLFALLAYIPFTYQQVHKGGLLPWLITFGKIHSKIYWIALAVALATLVPDFRRPRTRWLTLAFTAAQIVAGILLQFFPVMATLRNDVSSFWWSMAALVPLLWIVAIDFAGNFPRIEWDDYHREDDRRIFRTAWETAVFVSLVYGCIFCYRTSVDWSRTDRISVALATLLCHMLIFGVLFAALNVARSIASLTPRPSAVEYVLCNFITAGIGYSLVRSLVFRPISFEGSLADTYAATLALALVGCIAGMGVRLWRPDRGPIGGLALALSPVTIPIARRRWLYPLSLIPLGLLAGTLAVNTAIMDWNYMFQKLTASVIWVLSFAALFTMTPRLRGVADKRFTLLFWTAMIMSGYRLTASSLAAHPKTSTAIEKYAGYDASFRLIRDALSAPPKDDSFYKFLTQNTNIPRSVPTAPVNVDLAGPLTPGTGFKPHIFIITIDSFRRDYIGAYNSAVTFTPGIDSFAQESVIFRNAYTRYGGTGLAEPSIWVGGMTLHKQYVTPFYPMNALEKLLEAEKYRSYISMDAILRVIVQPTENQVELDSTTSGMDYRLCSSLSDLQSKLDQRAPGDGPAFAYTQPQDIHISVINREKTTVIDGGAYPGFYPPYASRVRRFDGCFGGFIQYLKVHGLYDNSIVVLTADHGDSLGEDGRWGHAYTLVPEVVRIPLLVHLPKQYQAMHIDAKAVAFQSDVTPTLYYLLGHKPTVKADFYGRPLIVETAAELQATRKSEYLIAASYAAVWGILGDGGRSLAVFDAVNYKDSYFDISDARYSAGTMSAQQREKGEEMVRKGIAEINAFYKFQPPK